jgi:tRNA dimethylallyltransferase
VVLNADSRQVYAGMDIGTSKIKPPQMRGFEHRLLDVAEPSSKLSLEGSSHRKLGASRVDHRSAAKIIVSRL